MIRVLMIIVLCIGMAGCGRMDTPKSATIGQVDSGEVEYPPAPPIF